MNHSRSRSTVILTGVVLTILGVLVWNNNIFMVESFVRTAGWVLVAAGVVTLVAAVLGGTERRAEGTDLTVCVLMILLGLFMAMWPTVLVSWIWSIVGVIILFTGISDIVEGRALRALGIRLGTGAIVSGVLTVILGIVTIFTPMTSLTLGMMIAGVALILDGVSEIITGLLMPKDASKTL